jgi:hypothetical protein
MAEKNRYPFDRHAREEKLNSERIAEAVSMAVLNLGNLKESSSPKSAPDGLLCQLAHSFFGMPEELN